MKSRFAKSCREIPAELDQYEMRKAATYMGEKPRGDCHIELFFGFFFDGTRNNMYLSHEAKDDSETNIARLWGVFDDSLDLSYSPRQHRFRYYIQGVGTRCMDKIGDPGIGAHAQAGASAAWGGEGRVNWALLKFHDSLYSHFMGSRLFTDDIGQETVSLVKQMSSDMAMPRFQIQQLAKAARMSMAQYGVVKPGSAEDVALRESIDWSSSLENVSAEHRATPNDEQRIAVLRQRNRILADRLKGFLANYPKIAKIRLSIFGFSRGAAEARVFSNWLVDACDPPEPAVPSQEIDPRGRTGGLRLCGIPVEIDFMGLFDTVASVGVAHGVLPTAFDGHGGWGRRQGLAIPAYVRRCVHMVAAHEIRGSFPLDLIDGDGHEEVVYPGAHSDVGGGYRKGEQGRIGAGDSKLSQIPLCDMYREAVAHGVPLRLDKFAAMQPKFAVSALLRNAFNAYLDATADVSQRAKTTQELTNAHYGLFLRWRHLRLMRGPEWLGDTVSAQRARRSNPQDYEDLVGANDELFNEVKAIDKGQADELNYPWMFVWNRLPSVYTADRTREQVARLVRGDKEQIWEQEIRTIWNTPHPLAPAVIDLYDNYVHDSRAGFKPFSDDDDIWFNKQRRRMRKLADREGAKQKLARDAPAKPQLPSINDQEKEELARWQADPNDLPMQTGGREPYWMWGYLRWRTLYTNPLPQALDLRRKAFLESLVLPRNKDGEIRLPGLMLQ